MATDAHALTTAEHSPVGGLAHDASGGISNPVLGMLLFITSEVMFFAGLFAAYFNVRANAPQWPPINAETGEAFHLEILPLVGPATVLLILSSFTCQFGVWARRVRAGAPHSRHQSCSGLSDAPQRGQDIGVGSGCAAGSLTCRSCR